MIVSLIAGVVIGIVVAVVGFVLYAAHDMLK